MANISDAFGHFIFDFSKSHLLNEEIPEWLQAFAEEITPNGDYGTCLQLDKTTETESNTFYVPFGGSGRWNYETTLKAEFLDLDDSDYLNKLLEKVGNLEIKVAYTDYESGVGFILQQLSKITIAKGQVKDITHSLLWEQNLTPFMYITYVLDNDFSEQGLNDMAEMFNLDSYEDEFGITIGKDELKQIAKMTDDQWSTFVETGVFV